MHVKKGPRKGEDASGPARKWGAAEGFWESAGRKENGQE